jgi:hypothetical protein
VVAASLGAGALLVWWTWLALRRVLPGQPLIWTSGLRLTIIGAALLFATGVWWGWPGGAWAPDEMWPEVVINGLARRFSDGWFDLYPPLHFYVLSAVLGPVLFANAVGAVALTPQSVLDIFWLMSRVVSILMAIGILVLMARFAQQCAGREFGWPVALCVGASLPLVFYAKMANLDVPYLFWFVASLLYFRASMLASNDRRVRHLVGFAITAAFAVTTKDQAYGLYVLPVFLLAYRTIQRPGGAWALAAALLAGGGVFAAVDNLWFNADGIRQHFSLIAGDGSESFRIVPKTLAGEWTLLQLTASQLIWCLGVPGVVLLALGGWQQWHRRAWPNWLWLFPLSYLLTFIAVIGYVYDRFLLAPLLMCGLLSASGLRLLIDRGRVWRVAAAVLGVWLVWRVASVDVLLVRDSRYAAEGWLRANVAKDALVATTWQAGYLPRLEEWRHQELRPTIEATLRADPDVVVVNAEFVNRYPGDAPQPTWLAWLESSEGPYREVFRYKSPLSFTELSWWPTFVDRRETLFTNLDKANPEIVIFRRR